MMDDSRDDYSIDKNPPELEEAATLVRSTAAEDIKSDETDKLAVNAKSIHFKAHFSVGSPSSVIRFRKKRMILYGFDHDEQVILEEDIGNEKDSITVKRLSLASPGLRFLRATYTMVALLVGLFVWAFCFQVILFLFLNMAADGGSISTNPEIEGVHVLAAVLSVPVFVHGMASVMAIVGTFVGDIWKGNPLFQRLMGFSNTVLMECLCVLIFLGVPGLTLAITLLSKSDGWWETTAWVWVWCVVVSMAIFAFLTVRCEVSACRELIVFQYGDEDMSTGRWVKRAILTTQMMFYSGYFKEGYLTDGEGKKEVISTSTSLYSKATTLSLLQKTLFEKIDPPVKCFSSDEVRDVTPILNSYNWSIERMFCRSRNRQMIYVQRGKGSLTPAQVKMSVVCSLFGGGVVALVVAGALVWFDNGWLLVGLVILALVACCIFPAVRSTSRLFTEYRKGRTSEIDSNAEDQENGVPLLQLRERFRFSQPKEWLCWTLFFTSVTVFFLLPLIGLLVQQNFRIALVFTFVGGFSGPRIYLNPVPLLRQFGSLTSVKLRTQDRQNPESSGNSFACLSRLSTFLRDENETDEEYLIRKKSRLSAIVGKLNNRGTVNTWMWIYSVLIAFAGLFVLNAFSAGGGGFEYKVKVPPGEVFLADGFYYPPQPKLAYPTCKVAKEDFTLFGPDIATSLMDTAFLATMAFAAPNESIPLLDQWFGEGQVIDEHEFVRDYRTEQNSLAGVSYKLFSFPSYPGTGLVSIRGSESMLDWVVDIQLWMAAAQAQIIRGLLPFGSLWNPILDDLVYLINQVEDASLKKVSYYRQTTKFVNDLLSGEYGNYSNVRVTGASLGGGLAIITGAQTNASTVSISGLNAMLSRRTFDPPISKEALDTHVFNAIPERDPIAAIDDPGKQYQRLHCRGPKNSLFACHSMWRAVCEFAYQCGSQQRPVLCWCTSKYGYPKPVQNGTLDWDTACNFTSSS